MYRKYTGKDELFSNVIVSFTLLLLAAILLYPRVIENNIYDYDTYLFLTVGALSVIHFLYRVIENIYYANVEVIDIEIDIKNEELKLKNNRKVYKFDQIKLFGRNKEKKQTRIVVNGQQVGFHDASMRDKHNNEIPSELVDEIGKYAIVTVHRRLYNFNLLAVLLVVTADFLFAFFTKEFLLFGITVNSLIIVGFSVLFLLIIYSINFFRIRNLINNPEIEVETEDS